MRCSFCQRTLYGKVYTCQCNQSVVSCSDCSSFDCYDCKREFKQFTIKWCTICKSDKLQANMFINSIYKYCYPCVLQKFKNCKTKNVILERYISEVDKYDIYQYLKKYCIQCHRALELKQNSEPVGIKQIYPLDNNLCQKCLDNKNSKANQKYQSKKYQSLQNLYQNEPQLMQYRRNSRQDSDYQRYDFQKQKIKKSSLKETPQQKWKRVQDYKYPQCLACQKRIYGESVITQEMILCSMCYRGSELSQSRLQRENKTSSLKNSRKSNQKQRIFQFQQQYGNDIKVPKTYLYDRNGENIMIPTHKSQYNNGISPSKILEPKTQNQMKKSQFSTASKKSRIQPTLKKVDSETTQKIKIEVKLPNDEQLIQCSVCGIQMETNSSIWEQQKNAPMCRCCFTDLLIQLQRQQKQANSLKFKNRKYMPKYDEYQAQQKQRLKEKEKIQNYLKGSPEKQKKIYGSEKVRKDKIEEKPFTNNKKLQSLNQPIIKQQDKKQSLNKVKRTESWDDNIIIQPVADHQQRKRQKVKKQQGVDQIVQQTNDSEEQSRSSQNVINTQDSLSMPKQKNTQNDRINVEPIIITDDQEQKQQKLIPNAKKEYQNINIINKQREKGANQVKISKVRSNEERPLNSFINEKSKQTEPLIIQQQQSKINNVKRMQSWDQQIVLQPVEDHEKRKKQKQKSQKQKQIQEEIQNNIKKQATKIQTKQRSSPNKKSPSYQNQKSNYPQTKQKQKKQYYQQKPHQYPTYQQKSSKPKYQERSYHSPKFQTNQSQFFKSTSSKLQKQIDQKFKNFGKGFNDPFFSSSLKNRGRMNIDQEFDDFKRQTQFQRPKTEARSKFFNQNDQFDRFYSKGFNSPLQQSLFREDDIADRYRRSGEQWKKMGESHYPKPQFQQPSNRFTAESPKFSYSQSPKTPQNYPQIRNNPKTQICGMCNKIFTLSSRQYRIHNKPTCLDCYGEWNRSLKNNQFK